MAKDRSWGDTIVIAAAAHHYNIPIKVITVQRGEEARENTIEPECEIQGGNPIWLGHIYDCHFVSLHKGTTFIKFITMRKDLLLVTGVLPIHDFHNGGHRESPGSSCMKTRSKRPTYRVAPLFVCYGEYFEYFKSDISYGKRYTWRFSSWKET